MDEIKTLDDALSHLEALCLKGQTQDLALRNYIIELANDNDKLKLSLMKMRTTAAKGNTTSSMHTKLRDALYE